MTQSHQLPAEVTRYLNKYGSSFYEIEMDRNAKINMAVVIPALMEYNNIRTLLSSLSENDPEPFPYTLIVFVVNNLSNASEEIKEDNRRSMEMIRNIMRKEASSDELINKVMASGLRLALVDISSPGREMPGKDGGVGLARKTGMDLALTVFDYSSDSEKVIVCLDSDCTVSKNYLKSIYNSFKGGSLKAASLNFSHTISGSSEKDLAIICYEIFLRYYVLGLKFASSPYAFHTIGSAMACTYDSYIKIEGMNKRKAAEDFYFLEKLAKTVKVQTIPDACVYPSGRGSWRVPFGTGQRVNRFLEHTHEEYLLYSPQSFAVLKEWLNIFYSFPALSADELLQEAGRISPALKDFLMQQNFPSDFSRILQNARKPDQLKRQKDSWFDGFRTLKLIHYLRDNGYPSVNMFTALDQMFSFLGVSSGIIRTEEIPLFEIQMEYLELLRKTESEFL